MDFHQEFWLFCICFINVSFWFVYNDNLSAIFLLVDALQFFFSFFSESRAEAEEGANHTGVTNTGCQNSDAAGTSSSRDGENADRESESAPPATLAAKNGTAAKRPSPASSATPSAPLAGKNGTVAKRPSPALSCGLSFLSGTSSRGQDRVSLVWSAC